MDWNTKKILVIIENDLATAKHNLLFVPEDENIRLARQKVIEAKALIREYMIENEETEDQE
jgi:hypothetical protein